MAAQINHEATYLHSALGIPDNRWVYLVMSYLDTLEGNLKLSEVVVSLRMKLDDKVITLDEYTALVVAYCMRCW